MIQKKQLDSGKRFLCFHMPFIQKIKRKKVIALTLQEINALFNNIRKILAMLDKIYHAVEGDKPEE